MAFTGAFQCAVQRMVSTVFWKFFIYCQRINDLLQCAHGKA